MPTYSWLARFRADFENLTPDQQVALLAAVALLVDDLRNDRVFRPALRIKGVKGASGIFEMTWAPDVRIPVNPYTQSGVFVHRRDRRPRSGRR